MNKNSQFVCEAEASEQIYEHVFPSDVKSLENWILINKAIHLSG